MIYCIISATAEDRSYNRPVHCLQDADADGSGSIDFTEFVELMIKADSCDM